MIRRFFDFGVVLDSPSVAITRSFAPPMEPIHGASSQPACGGPSPVAVGECRCQRMLVERRERRAFGRGPSLRRSQKSAVELEGGAGAQ